MTQFEDTILQYVVDYVDDNCLGSLLYAASELGVSYNTLSNWVDYYISDGGTGSAPHLSKIGYVLDVIGVPIVAPGGKDTMSGLESAVLYFLDSYVTDKCAGDVSTAGKKLGVSAPKLRPWLAYYRSGGAEGSSPRLDSAAQILTALKVTFTAKEETR